MSSNVVVVESPAKAKTIEKYLGKDFKVLASYGHVRDLRAKEGAVDPDNRYAMTYQVLEKNEKHVNAIAAAVKKADTIYLATDPDREGEAISWHLCEILKERGLLEGKPVHRVVFYEITEKAIKAAINSTGRATEEDAWDKRDLSLDLVNAQQARRALDYLFGFTLSPFLWKKVMPSLSAGRVQSPALRLIVEREDEIDAFRSQEYWSLEARTLTAGGTFGARLVEYQRQKVVDSFNREKPEPFTFNNEAQSTAARQALEQAAGGKLKVSAVERSQRRRRPAPPFTTSTLQQEAARKLGFRARRTMSIAQKLYEGIDVGDGTVGLITYMRTDSVGLAADAITDIRAFITERYGKASLPATPNVYKTTAKNAQEAHEGIRPTSIRRVPDDIKTFLTEEEFKLYTLIWKRTVACQMEPAVYDQLAVDLVPAQKPDTGRFRATGSTLISPGFIAVYLEGQDDAADDDTDVKLPNVAEGDVLSLQEVQASQHFTEPPPRYTEASLVKALEEFGIGRPSTYASIISTLNERKYVEMDGKRFIPTDTGRVVGRLLTKHFARYVDYNFTAHMEDELDEISRGEREWVPVLDEFWQPFKQLVADKENTVSREEASQSRELGVHPVSGKKVSVKIGRYGPYVQVGTKDDADKPTFKGLMPGQKMSTITLAEGLELFKLPRKLGQLPDGSPVVANVGQFGPYVQYEVIESEGKKKKYVSLKEHDPMTITLEQAIEVIQAKIEADAKKLIRDFPESGIRVLMGRWGPYITDGERNARVPKDTDAAALSLEICQELLSKAPPARGRWKKKTAKKDPTPPTDAAKDSEPKTAKPKAARKKATKKAGAKKVARKKAAQSDVAAPVSDESSEA